MGYSIIVPTFNAMASLERCLDSVLAQADGWTVEILVVDDGSSDGTQAITERYAAQYPNVVGARTEVNSGPGIARNLGVERASQDWVCFLDADDALEPGFFAALAAHQDAEVIAFDGCVLQGDSRAAARSDLSQLESLDQAQRLDHYLLNRIDPSVIFHAFRRSFLQANAIRFQGGLHEDVDYMFRVHQLVRQLAVCPQQIYRKHDTQGSIINTLGEAHLRGYFRALTQILAYLDETSARERHLAAFRTGVKNVASSRIMRLLRQSIEKQAEPEALLTTLYSEASALLARIEAVPKGGFQTKYELMCDDFLSMMEEKRPFPEILEALEQMSRKSWSCFDLHHSVFLAPGEIRTCCKRFFADGRLKGDVVLLQSENGVFSYEDVLREKRRLYAEINRNESDECSGCPFLTFSDWGAPLSSGIKYLSLEYHSICNMRCVYCSDTYYGGKKPAYDVERVVETAAAAGALSQCEYIVWGGGEPLVDQAFPKIAEALSKAVPQVRQRVITNATLFSEPLAQQMERDLAFIVTSIDAGTQPVFEAVRGYKHFDRVLGNLKAYAQRAPQNIFLKYILMDENSSEDEIKAFADLVEANGLLGCNFQISCNFKRETVALDQLLILSRLYALLLQKGAHFVFLDDLVWQRLPMIDEAVFKAIRDQLQPICPDALVPREQVEEIAVWGTGAQARLLMQKSWLLRQAKVAYFIDPRPHVVGTSFMGKPVRPPQALHEDGLPVVIAAVQSAPFIYRDIQALKLADSRIVKGLLL